MPIKKHKKKPPEIASLLRGACREKKHKFAKFGHNYRAAWKAATFYERAWFIEHHIKKLVHALSEEQQRSLMATLPPHCDALYNDYYADRLPSEVISHAFAHPESRRQANRIITFEFIAKALGLPTGTRKSK